MRIIPITILAALALMGCPGEKITSITVEPDKLDLTEKGQSETLKANAKSGQGGPIAVMAVNWTSSHPDVATVDDKGKVTALKSGEAVVTAEAQGVKGNAKVNVAIAGSVEVKPDKLEIVGVGQKVKLTAVVRDDIGKEMPDAIVYWRTSDQNVATVQDGEVTSVAPGTVKISAVHAAITTVVETTVKMPDFAKLVAKPPKLDLLVTETDIVEVSAVDPKNTAVPGVPVEFSSSDDKIATVSHDGGVTAVKKGKVKITAKAGDKTVVIPVTIK